MSKVARRAKTAIKTFWRYVNYSRVKTPVFVLGCQRSGTTLVLDVASRSPKVHSYHEGDRTILDARDHRLISEEAVCKAIAKTPEPIILFKPLNDSQNVDRLLELHENAKVIWLYRHYRDVVDSAVKKWGDAHRTMVLEVGDGNYSSRASRAIGERVAQDNLKLVKQFVRKNMSPWDGAALLWYLRNSIYFDASLPENTRATLFKYGDLVTEPDSKFAELFRFIGAGYSPKYTADVHASSFGKKNDFEIDQEIETLCKAMMTRLYEAYISSHPRDQGSPN
jgi:Sulfotransferase domain